MTVYEKTAKKFINLHHFKTYPQWTKIMYLPLKSLEWTGKQFLLAETEGRHGLYGQGNLEMTNLFCHLKISFPSVQNNSNIVVHMLIWFWLV